MVETLMPPPLKLRVFAVMMPDTKRLRFMSNMQFRHYVGAPRDLTIPDTGQTLVFNDLHPFGAHLTWVRVTGGLTLHEMIDSNLAGERVVHG